MPGSVFSRPTLSRSSSRRSVRDILTICRLEQTFRPTDLFQADEVDGVGISTSDFHLLFCHQVIVEDHPFTDPRIHGLVFLEKEKKEKKKLIMEGIFGG